MVGIVVSLLLGFFIGYFLKISNKLIKFNGKVQGLTLYLLIFTMGMGIGVDETILKSLPTIGVKSLCFAIITIIGSALFTYFLEIIFKKGETK